MYMIVAHRILKKEYDIDCKKYEIKTIGELKSYLLNYIENVRYDNIKLFDHTGALENDKEITDDMVYLGMAIVPITCHEHKK